MWVLLMGAVRSACAQGAGAPTPPAPPLPSANDSVGFRADLGLVNTSGNTAVTTVNFSDGLTVRTSRVNQIGQSFGVVYGTLSNRVQTSLWVAGLRDTYTFTPTVGLFALVNFDRNTFAGIDRRFEEGGGAAIIAVKAPRDQLEVDLGATYVEQRSTAAIEHDYPSGLVTLTYHHTFGKNEYFEQTVESIPDLTRGSDYRINAQSSLVAPLSRHLAIKVGYGIRYANLPPPGFKTTDRLLTTDVQLSL